MYVSVELTSKANQAAQPTSWRREDDPQYRDDPEFERFTTELSDKLFTFTSNVSRLSNEIAKLGTKNESNRVRERIQDLLEETSAGFKDVGEGLKKVQAWSDLNVGSTDYPCALVLG